MEVDEADRAAAAELDADDSDATLDNDSAKRAAEEEVQEDNDGSKKPKNNEGNTANEEGTNEEAAAEDDASKNLFPENNGMHHMEVPSKTTKLFDVLDTMLGAHDDIMQNWINPTRKWQARIAYTMT